MLLSTTKLVKFLSTFSKSELQHFEKWLASPWCNSTKCLVDIFVVLKKHHPNFDKRKLTKHKLFEKALGKAPSDRRMNNLLSEMYLQAEQFLIHEQVKNNHFIKTDLLTNDFSKRNLKDWFNNKTKNELENLDKKQVWETADHLFNYHLNKKIDNQTSLTLKERKESQALKNSIYQLLSLIHI